MQGASVRARDDISRNEEDAMKWIKAPKLGDAPRQAPSLDQLYGRIGISAVAAAVRYQSDAKNLAYAPVEAQADDRLEDLAA
jgi:hypothetical protein